MKKFNGKAIYNPGGKAGEYAQWACNFYVGCSNGCKYCYCKKGILAPVMGQYQPQLKKCFRDEGHAFEIFRKELTANLSELKTHGLFFSFTTDPMLEETGSLTRAAMYFCHEKNVPVQILTKRAEWVDSFIEYHKRGDKSLIAIGFTLTGRDDWEPGASTNAERIEAMKKLSQAGFRTFASIEPIIVVENSADMVYLTIEFCDLYRIGIMSGKKYPRFQLQWLINTIINTPKSFLHPIFYFKDSLLKQAGIDRAALPANCVGRDYNIFL